MFTRISWISFRREAGVPTPNTLPPKIFKKKTKKNYRNNSLSFKNNGPSSPLKFFLEESKHRSTLGVLSASEGYYGYMRGGEGIP